MIFDHLLTVLANSNKASRQAYIKSFKRMGEDFDIALAAYDESGTDEARDALFREYKLIFSRIISAECGVYTAWYCYLAIRPHTKELRKKMRSALAERFGDGVLNGELHPLVLFSTDDTYASKKRAELRGLRHLRIPDGVLYVADGKYASAGIKTLYLPDSLTEIDNYAFASNLLRSVSIGPNVTKIGEGAFGAGKKRLKIKFRGYHQQLSSLKLEEAISPWMSASVDCLDGKLIIGGKDE